MLKKKLNDYIQAKLEAAPGTIELYETEKEYAMKHSFVNEETVIQQPQQSRFENAYVEISNKETDELVSEEDGSLLRQPVRFLKERQSDYLYIDSEWFGIVGADSVTVEKDDVFGHYEIMAGLHYQKKAADGLKSFFEKVAQGAPSKTRLLFDGNEGVWTLNFELNQAEGFSEDMTLEEALGAFYTLLFRLAETLEAGK